MARRARGRRLKIALLAFGARQMLRALRWTTRRRYGQGMAAVFGALAAREPVILAFWHGELALLQLAYPDRDSLCVQISRHGDGEVIARAVGPLGIRAVRGSANRGGAAGLLGMIRAHRDGLNLGMAVDGPTGPRYRVKPGVVLLAAKTGAPVYPVVAAANRGLRARSWDRFVVPAPGATIDYRAGGPIRVPAGAGRDEIEAARVRLERSLFALGDPDSGHTSPVARSSSGS